MSGTPINSKNPDGDCYGDPGALKEFHGSGDDDMQMPAPPMSHRRMAESLGAMKEPWVPAPGRSTRISGYRQSGIDHGIKEKCSSAPEMTISATSLSSGGNYGPQGKSPGFGFFGLSNRSQSKSRPKRERGRVASNIRKTGERSKSGYKLQTKDSLIDITACLQAKREEVLQLWQQNLPNSDPNLLAELEKANQLALEATKEVAKLRNAIQELQNKGKKLSTEEAEALDQMRNKIFSKLHNFQEAHSQIQVNLRKSRESRLSRRSRGSQTSVLPEKKVSSTTLHPIPSKTSSSLIYLKDKPSYFSEPDTENEMDAEQFQNFNSYLKSQENPALDGDSGSASETVDLVKLTKLYSEKFELPKLPKHSPAELIEISEEDSGQRNEYGDKSSEIHIPEAEKKHYDNFDSSCSYYRDKIHQLYKKLLDQESKYEEMNREIQRVDSEKGFELKLLKSNIKSQLDDLAPLPELIELSEKRLNDAILSKFAIESSLQLKVQEIKVLKTEIERLQKELKEAKSKLAQAELKNDNFNKKMDALNDENKKLRIELSTRNDLMIRLEQRLEGQNQGQVEAQGTNQDTDRRHMVLEDRILELEQKLSKEKKKTSILKNAKDNLSRQMSRREEELMSSLESTRARNRALQTKMQLVKSSYYELFSPIYGNSIFPETMKAVSEHSPRQPENEDEDIQHG